MSGLTIDTAPACEPVTAEEAKTHLRVEIDDDNGYIESLVSACRLSAEDYLQRALIDRTLELTLDRFPPSSVFLPNHHGGHSGHHDPAIYLPRSPVSSVTSIQYIDDAGALQTLNASKFKVDIKSLVPRIVPAFGEVWPTTRAEINAVMVKFVAGYGTAGADVPAAIIHALKLMVGTYYDPVRATVIVGSASEVPQSARFLLGPFRVGTRAGSYNAGR